jgi:hypothetical protein
MYQVSWSDDHNYPNLAPRGAKVRLPAIRCRATRRSKFIKAISQSDSRLAHLESLCGVVLLTMRCQVFTAVCCGAASSKDPFHVTRGLIGIGIAWGSFWDRHCHMGVYYFNGFRSGVGPEMML